MDDRGALDVELLGAPQRGRQRFVVRDGARIVGRVETSRHRRVAHATGVAPGNRAVEPLPPAAWPAASANRAAADRWADRHLAVVTVSGLELEDGTGERVREVLEAVGAHLVESGARRLDIRVPAAHAVTPWLHGPGWMQGAVGDTVVLSRSLRYPWSPVKESAQSARKRNGRLPQPVRRLGRRLSNMHPAQVPELTRIATGEVVAAVRFRYTPGSPRIRPADGAPPGTFPFAVTRYRTIRTAFALVPPELRSTRLVDIGCGDGRVLREAIEQGWPSVHGRELDPELGARARAAIGRHGTVEVGDGLIAPLPDDAGVVYLNNPFQADGLARLATLLADTLARRPRPLVVIYINPRTVEPLQSAGFVLVQCTPAFSVLTSVSA